MAQQFNSGILLKFTKGELNDESANDNRANLD